jgi:seryl-tRNA synthetase
MLDIKFIRENAELVKDNCEKRRVKVDIDKLLSIDETRRELLTRVEGLRAEKNKKIKRQADSRRNPKHEKSRGGDQSY